MLPKFWKRSEGLVIKSNNDPFDRARLTLLALYAIAIIITLFIGYNRYKHYVELQSVKEELQTKFMADGFIDPSEKVILTQLNMEERKTFSLNLVTTTFIFFFIYLTGYIPLRHLDKVLKSQKRFIHNISHELNTPLSIIRANNQLNFSDCEKLTAAKFFEITKSNNEEVERIQNIIHNLSILASVENNAMTFSKIDLVDVVSGSIKQIQEQAKSKNIKLSFIYTDSTTIFGNFTALEQMITNVLRNAVSYTPEAGSVSISIASNKSKYIEVVIKDTGIGIAREDLPFIFEPFFKVDKSKKKDNNSSGLGLTLVRAIAKKHKISFDLVSKLGKGTVFYLSFPQAG